MRHRDGDIEPAGDEFYIGGGERMGSERDAIGPGRRQPAIHRPEIELVRLLEYAQHHVLMIATQKNALEPVGQAVHQYFDDTAAVRPPFDIVANEYQNRAGRRRLILMRGDPGEQRLKQIQPAVNIADVLDSDAVGDACKVWPHGRHWRSLLCLAQMQSLPARFEPDSACAGQSKPALIGPPPAV
jgi:hypothetical protein